MLADLDLARVRSAAERIEPHVVRTPLLSAHPNADCELLLKPESLQPTGAFKLRGALNKIATLPDDCAGVVAHSSGNHAQAVAYAARLFELPAVIVMPNDAPAAKLGPTEAAGAEVVIVGPDSDERADRARQLAGERGWTPVEPFDDLEVAAGQGTCALEMMEDAASIDRFYAPIGGGGLMAGCSVVMKALCPAAEIIGCEPEDAGDTRLSLEAGKRCAIPPPRTIADGLRVRRPGEQTFPVLKKTVDRIELVSDEELLGAMVWALRTLRLIIEPSGAASLALALREGRGRCGVILSGGNVDPALLEDVAARAARLG